LDATRQHWGIENNLHWMLDVNFHEDASRKKAGQCRAKLFGNKQNSFEPSSE
jgi:predicted transposase YbfD/YdcC